VLYFSKIRIFLITFFTLFFVCIFLSNFIKTDNFLFNKNINLGLDLQGGSYLLLEIDNSPVIIQKLQNSIPEFKKFFKEKEINLRNFKIIEDKFLSFEANNDKISQIKVILEDKEDNFINQYYPTYKSHKFDFLIEGNLFKSIFLNVKLLNDSNPNFLLFISFSELE